MTELEFTPAHFDPEAAGGTRNAETGTVSFRAPDGTVYVYSPEVILAVNLALAARRPLLVTCAPGSGKSSLAPSVAAVKQWRYYSKVITSRLQARDLQWRFDALRRLGDAQALVKGKKLGPRAAYVEPQTLWWAFAPNTAEWRGAAPKERRRIKIAENPCMTKDPNAVVLLDEIDKAEPDVPNDLLEPLDVGRFVVEDLDLPVSTDVAHRVLLVITTNRERELPPAFLRRCVVLDLPDPTQDWLVDIANERFKGGDEAFHRDVAKEVLKIAKSIRESGDREASTAEYLDALSACDGLDIEVCSETWEKVAQALLKKSDGGGGQ